MDCGAGGEAGVSLLRVSAGGCRRTVRSVGVSTCTSWECGSQQGEEKLRELFPEARIGRMDRDTVRGRHDMERLLARLHSGEINLLVGTQMIAKGHDIHGVTLVGVVGADHALGMPDFRAAERVFQLLTQVSGTGGAGGAARERCWCRRIIADHYAVKFAQKHDYAGFVAKEMHVSAAAALSAVCGDGECEWCRARRWRRRRGGRRSWGGGLSGPSRWGFEGDGTGERRRL